MSKQLETTFFHLFIFFHTLETNFQVILQQWQHYGSNLKTTYYLLFDVLPINQKQKWFDNLIHHIKTIRNHYLSLLYPYYHTLETKFKQLCSSDKIMVQYEKTNHWLSKDLPLNQKSKWFDIGFTISKQLETTYLIDQSS